MPDSPTGAPVVDVSCTRCGYALRGLSEDGRCPECGTPVGLSTRGPLLRYADPNWLDSVGRGLSIILWTMWLGLIVGVSAWLIFGDGLALRLLQFIASAIAFYGAWLITEPDPSGISERDVIARKVARVCIAICPLASAIPILSSTPLGLIAFGTILAISGMVGEFAKYIYFERLALRVPNHALASRAVLLRWLVASIGALVVIAAMGARLAGFAIFLILAALILGVFCIMTAIFLLRLRRHIIEEAGVARRAWTG